LQVVEMEVAMDLAEARAGLEPMSLERHLEVALMLKQLIMFRLILSLQ
jgi:hypothetical protein